jgi:hypothetical protein
MEKNSWGIQEERFRTQLDWMPGKMDKLFRPSNQQKRLGVMVVEEIVRSSWAGWHTLVCCSEIYRSVIKHITKNTKQDQKSLLRNPSKFYKVHSLTFWRSSSMLQHSNQSPISKFSQLTLQLYLTSTMPYLEF